jgi:hypothetical protein
MAIPMTQNSSPVQPRQQPKKKIKKEGGTQKSFTLDDWVGKKGEKICSDRGLELKNPRFLKVNPTLFIFKMPRYILPPSGWK